MTRPTVTPDRGVCLAYLYATHTEGLFTSSIVKTLIHDGNHRRHIWNGGTIDLMTGPPLDEARNDVVRRFLADPGLGAWLWFVDTDMMFPPDTLDRLVGFADVDERPVVAGLCFAGSFTRGVRTTMYVFVGEKMDTIVDWDRGNPIRVDGTGAACLLIHRSTLARMGQKFGGWFTDNFDGRKVSEDVGFCRRLHAMGVPVWVHTGIRIDHVKPWPLNEALYDAMRP